MNKACTRQLFLFTAFIVALQSAFTQTNAPPTISTATNQPESAISGRKLNLPPPKQKVNGKLVYVIPIQGEIGKPMVYLVRRGIKDAIADNASIVVVEMDTPGGTVTDVLEIMDLLERVPVDTYTFVDKEAFSGGAYIAAATRFIYMAPGSVIGAAAVITVGSGGQPQSLPDTMDAKFTSALAAKIRAAAERNGHNEIVFEAMVNKNKGLTIDGKEIIKWGEILTLTNTEAEREYGNPPKKLLSEGTVENLDALLKKVGYANTEVKRVEPTGAEQLAQWITAIAPVLLLLGILGIYIEIKLQTFGLIGVLAILCLVVFFFGHYVAGLSGLEYLALFAVGVILLCLEFFLFPGTAILGILGTIFIIISLIMAMVDHMPNTPVVPTMPQLELPLMNFGIAVAGSIIFALLLSKFLPKTALFNALVLQSASGGVITGPTLTTKAESLIGTIGKSISPLRPAGKAMIGDKLIDVVTEGDHIPPNTPIKVVAVEGARVVVAKA